MYLKCTSENLETEHSWLKVIKVTSAWNDLKKCSRGSVQRNVQNDRMNYNRME